MSAKVEISQNFSESDESELIDSDGEADSVSGSEQNDTNDDSENSVSHDGEAAQTSKTGLADVFSKILSNKQQKKTSVILAKGQTDREIVAQKRKKIPKGDTEDARGADSDDSDHEKTKEQQIKRRKWEEMSRVKPSVLDRTTERSLQKIATRGVVQLFNAVRAQQKSLEDKLKEVGSSEIKREKVVQSMTKGRFLDMLKNDKTTSSVANVTAEGVKEKSSKSKTTDKAQTVSTSSDPEKPAWGILREDFMMGAKMKDWDKQSDDENTQSDHSDSDALQSD